MPKAKYRLKTILEVHAGAKQQAVGLLAERRASLTRAEEELAQRVRTVMDSRALREAASARMKEQSKSPVPAHQLNMHRAHLDDLKRTEQELIAEVARQRAVVSRAAVEVKRAEEELVKASRELRAIEIHKEKWTEQQRLSEEQAEQKLQDEIGSIMHRRRSSE